MNRNSEIPENQAQKGEVRYPGLNDFGNFITPEQAAKTINVKAVSGRHIRELCRRGIIEHICPPGTKKIYLIKPGSIRAWLDKGKRPGKF